MKSLSSLARRMAAVTLLLALGCDAQPPATAPASAANQPQSLPTISLTINGNPLTLQVADNDAKREKGLMYVHDLPADHGMIFVFPVERPLVFWMKNTPIDLDIVYADHDGRVVSVKTMRAYDESNVPSDEPASYAIELGSGIAAKLKVAAGDHLTLPPDLIKNAK